MSNKLEDEAWEDNPLHRIGYGRGDDEQSVPRPAPRKTAAYSFVNGKPVEIGLQEINVEPTQPMNAVSDKPLTVKDVISRLIESDVQAWKSLPQSVRDGLLDRPQEFQFVGAFPDKAGGIPFDILYNGVVFKYSASGVWVLYKIVR